MYAIYLFEKVNKKKYISKTNILTTTITHFYSIVDNIECSLY